jgi:hypothetical protein
MAQKTVTYTWGAFCTETFVLDPRQLLLLYS